MVVVDASVALKWFVAEEGTPAALSLLAGGDHLIAPELVIAEMCNAAWRLCRIGRMTQEQVGIVAEKAMHLFGERIRLDLLSARASSIALQLDHPAYDCFYLALAEQRDTRVLTADRRFVAKTRASPWSHRAVALTDFASR